MPIVSEEKQEKYNIIPANEIRLPTDNLSATLFRLTDETFTKLLEEIEGINEIKDVQKRLLKRPSMKVTEKEGKEEAVTRFWLEQGEGEIEAITKFWLEVLEDCDTTPIANLTHTDQRVLAACMAEQQKGNKVTTTSVIFRDLGGVGYPKPETVEKYLKSINKMMSLIITIDATDAYKKLYQIHDEAFINVLDGEQILPAKWRLITLNGVPNCAAIKFKGVSPVFKYALSKGQITTIPSNLLRVPHTKNTEDFLELKAYILYRISLHKKNPKTNKPVMRLETLYKHCGFTVKITDRQFKKRLRENIAKFMEYLKNPEPPLSPVITSFKTVDDDDHEQKNLKDCTKITYECDN